MATLNEIFCEKVTENGDIAYTKVGDNTLVNILFLTEYYQKYLNEIPTLGNSDKEQLFAMFIRDPRFGLGRRDLGRKLLSDTGCTIEQIVKSGRVDDLFFMERFDPVYCQYNAILDWCKEKILTREEYEDMLSLGMKVKQIYR